jgi:hypothetical protein
LRDSSAPSKPSTKSTKSLLDQDEISSDDIKSKISDKSFDIFGISVLNLSNIVPQPLLIS